MQNNYSPEWKKRGDRTGLIRNALLKSMGYTDRDIEKPFIGIINTVIDCLNVAIGALNSLNFTIPAFGIDVPDWIPGIGGMHWGMPETKIGISGIEFIEKLPLIEQKASGGFVDTGDMFIANEAGPELIGRIGNKTAVANNDQIVSGVANGVAAGQSEQNALLRRQNELLTQLLNKKMVAEAIPSSEWARFNKRSEQMYARNVGG